MTGFGSGESIAKDNSVKIITEISSVNRKQLELRIALPRELNSLEIAVKKLLQQSLKRGMINVKISMELSDELKAKGIKINKSFIKEVFKQTQKLEKELAIEENNKTSIKDLLKLHGAFEEDAFELPIDIIQEVLFESINIAATNIVKMRKEEGRFLLKDIKERLIIIQNCVLEAEKYAEEIPILQRQKLMKKLQEANLSIDLNDDRVVREIIIFAERADVSEEITRLKSHFKQFDNYLSKNDNEAIGRSLDFIIQEMNREVTTLGNKVGNSNISPLVITMKTQLEKIREQIQNVE